MGRGRKSGRGEGRKEWGKEEEKGKENKEDGGGKDEGVRVLAVASWSAINTTYIPETMIH